MRDAIAGGLLVDAEACGCDVSSPICPVCYDPVCYVAASNAFRAHFRHKKRNKKCRISINNDGENHLDDQICEDRASRKMSPWHSAWQCLNVIGEHCIEARNICGDPRPRDLGDSQTGDIVELQHSYIPQKDFVCRNSTCNHAIWIFDATDCELFSYEKYSTGMMLCIDRFRETFPTELERVIVLFHCSDGQLYQTLCDDVVEVLYGGEKKCVRTRLLGQVSQSARRMLDRFFGYWWPLSDWCGCRAKCEGVALGTPIKVISTAGRSVIDECHRSYMTVFPVDLFTIYQAPPGAGKSRKVMEVVLKWASPPLRKTVLVITFNKANQEMLQASLANAGSCSVRTLDSLCFEACHRPSNLITAFSDKKLVHQFFKRANAGMKITRYGGKRSSAIVDFQLRHPQGGCKQVCKFHSRLTRSRWNANINAYPIREIVQEKMTFSALRYICDKRMLLSTVFDKYDAVVVDEMQDFSSAQELRLLRQSQKPVVMVGDSRQEINSFRDDLPCNDCKFEQEILPTLPDPIEWYGTWRLDTQTVRFMQDRFGCRMHSFRASYDTVTIRWQMELHKPHDTLVLCRFNESVVEFARKFDHFSVVDGATLASRLGLAAADHTMVSPMARYAHNLESSGALQQVCNLLRERESKLNELSGPAVCTVHKAKGFEYDHCAIHADLLDIVDTDLAETNIRFVAFTRHRKSLTILCDPTQMHETNQTDKPGHPPTACGN
jgi:hypothetical protein